MHFSVLVIGENYEELLDRYGPDSVGELLETREEVENKLYKEFTELDKSLVSSYKKDPDKFKKQYILNHYKTYLIVRNYDNLKNKTEKQIKNLLYESVTPFYWGDVTVKVYSDGVYRPGITEWDWYEVGGRWVGLIKLKDLVKSEKGLNFCYGYSVDSKVWVLSDNCTDSARKKDILNLDELLSKRTRVVLSEEFDWVDIINSEDEYYKELVSYVTSLPDDTRFTIIDCHI